MITDRIDLLLLHIPDGFLSALVALLGWLLAIAGVSLALRHSGRRLDERQIPLLGVMAAFIFAAQAINFPVAGGTSGHLLGGALAAIVLGPWSAVLVMIAVISLQALLFQDGGLLVMGWNIMNMGVITALSGAVVYSFGRRFFRSQRTALIVAGAAAAWISVEASAVATAMELAASGASPLQVALPALAGVHALIGIGEAAITVGALLLILSTRPDILTKGDKASGGASATWIGAGLIMAIIVAVFSFAASGSQDGLERFAEETGLIARALDPLYTILPDFSIPFIRNEAASGIVAVLMGTLLIFGLAYLVGQLAKWLRRA